MLPVVEEAFDGIKSIYGEDSIARVEMMIDDNQAERLAGQEQAKWIMPGLSTTGWLEKDSYAVLSSLIGRLEDVNESVRQEVNEIYCNHSELLDTYRHYLVDNSDWKALYLFRDGKALAPIVDGINRMPVTWLLLQKDLKDWLCPLLEMHFSILEPNTEIPPHCDLWNFTLNLHLAIEIPDQCGIKVGDEVRCWQQGECLLFDYSFLHSAWNRSGQRRVCLLMDIWHPDLTDAEKTALTAFITELRKIT
tara:strand:- start:1963 stop:2709 length:747 start_codon:yes stop_codon:yes gene_type:complete